MKPAARVPEYHGHFVLSNRNTQDFVSMQLKNYIRNMVY